MPLTTKYIPVIKLMEDLKVKDITTREERGALIIHGIARSEKDRDLILGKISQVNRDEASDVSPDIIIDSQT